MTGPMLNRLEAICRSTAAKWECEVLEFNGEADHVHLLLALTPKVLPSAFVNNLKTVTSRLLRKEFADHLKKNITGAIRYSGVAVIASSPWVVRHCPCSNNTWAMRPTMSNSRDGRNDHPLGECAAHCRPNGRPCRPNGRPCRPNGRSPPPEPPRGYRRSTAALSGRNADCSAPPAAPATGVADHNRTRPSPRRQRKWPRECSRDHQRKWRAERRRRGRKLEVGRGGAREAMP